MPTADAVVVGAGAAGQTAAYHLQKSGLSVKVLEASEQIGGRLRKDESGLADFPIDLGGGAWIHGAPRKILNAIVDEDAASGVETVLHDTRRVHVWTGQRWIKFPTIPLPCVRDSWGYKFVGSTWGDFFNDNVAAKLRPGTIALNTAVSSVDYAQRGRSADSLDGKVQVTCVNGDVYECSYIIITVSIKLLQENAITFTPALPAHIRRAISHYRMGLSMKVFMKFKETFYPKQFLVLKSFSDIRKYFRESAESFSQRDFWDETFGQQSDCHVLGMYCYGKICQHYLDLYEQGGNQAVIDDVLSELDAMFDGKASKFHERSVVTLWPNEKFVRTGFTHWTNSEDIDQLQHPVGDKRIFFAGEAIPVDQDSWGFAHGAAMSGKDAARKVVELKRTGRYTPTKSGCCSIM